MKAWSVVSEFSLFERWDVSCRYSVRRPGFYLGVAFLWLIFAWLLIPWPGSSLPLITVWLMMGLVISGAYCLMGVAVLSLSLMLRLRKSRLLLGAVKHSVNEQGIREQSPGVDVAFTWLAVKSIKMLKNYVVLELKIPSIYLAIKKNGFESEHACDAFYWEVMGAIGQRASRSDHGRAKRLVLEVQELEADSEAGAELRERLGRSPSKEEIRAHRWAR